MSIYREDTLYSSVDWTDFDPDRTYWRAVVSTVMNTILQKCGEFLDKFSNYILTIFLFFSLIK